MLTWDTKDISNLAGEISLVAGLVRRRFFEVFFYTHYLYIVFHVGISYSLISFPGFYIFMVDRFLRFLQSRDNIRLLSAIRDVIATRQKKKKCKITLICAFKNSSEISMLDLVLPLSGLQTQLSSDITFKIEAFITREKEARSEKRSDNEQNENTLVRTKSFRPTQLSNPRTKLMALARWNSLILVNYR
ncbi:hypothetical protein Bca52824_092667 [Brassica carinata]|uniref:Ferric reductase NAD binding domain-containing protein n=1 Tax=Brassica carinata TaxID=52824 RepID=A0A8X7TDX7_BRACI|nr:hypothetical protein Bca52824_092667 [Brassica carinata]